ncbi:MAG: cellulose synthase/poly-beta-1,6-N-acetylglucosamine synthase-like glycosyltransferase [Flavobacteriales bacterium]|jgi:cellulose synthase/poly-beta-1,6-N-acetylglucosamine synthase-like glycosyltransferase
MMIVLFVILGLYFFAILLLVYGFHQLENQENSNLTPKIAFTIIVPFREENENLPLLLASIAKMKYPLDLVTLLLVDDGSSEKFKIPFDTLQVSIINNIRVSNSPKKDAISTAIPHVKTDWIITTDADCIVNENWLLTLNNYIQTRDVAMIAGAVNYEGNGSFLHHFQQLDFASLQGATMGSFGIGKGFMCNGANFAYTKSLFEDLNGFDGNNMIASGDDVFLLQKAIAKCPEKVHYLKSKNTIVTTQPLNDWKSLFYQRVRWASKTSSYQSNFGKALGLLVFAGNLCWLICFGLTIIGALSIQMMLLIFSIKFLVDTLLIYPTNQFLTKNKLRYLLLSSLLYSFFSTCVAVYSQVGKYEWKGRKFRL